MKLIRKIFIIFLITACLIEFSLIFGNRFINDNFLFYLPNTKLKLKILEDRDMRIPRDVSGETPSLINIDKKKILYRPLKTVKRKPDLQDIKHGAVDYYYYVDGFCNKKNIENYKKDSIVAFGDSFTYCTFINPDGSWIKKTNLKNFNYEKINYGVTGTDLKYQILLMEQLLKKNHKIIFSSIYEGNDLRNIKNNNYLKEEKKVKLPEKKDYEFLKKLIKKLFGNLYTFNYFSGARNLYLSYKNNTLKLNFKYRDDFKKINYNINNIDQDELVMAKKIFQNKIKFDQIYNFYNNDMLKIKNIAKKNNSILIFLYIPSAYNVIPKVIFENQDTEKYLKKMHSVQRTIFNKICNNNKLNCIDLTQNLINANLNSIKITHFPSNLHLTNFGHEVIANSLSKYLSESTVK